MAEVYRYAFSRALFDQAPENHRLGYLMLGQLWNDCIILTRQLLAVRNKPPEGKSDLEMHAQIASELLNLRLLASRLHEGASLLRRLGTFSQTWKKDLDAETVAAVGRVLRYFADGEAPLSRLRNKMGFHQDSGVAQAALDTIGDDELVDYHGRFYATTLYMSAEALNLRALAVLLGTDTAREALNRLAEDALQILSDTNNVCQGYHRWFLDTHIVPQHPLSEGQIIQLNGVLAHDEVMIPFFVNFDRLKDDVDARAAATGGPTPSPSTA